MSNESNFSEPLEVLPPIDPRSLVRIPQTDAVEIIRMAVNKTKTRGRPAGSKNRPRAPVVKTSTKVVRTATKRIPRKQHAEDEQQLAAFEYYLGLGRDRTLAKVAEHFNLTPECISQWSARLSWTNRIRTIENRDTSQIVEDTLWRAFLDKSKGLFINDPVEQKKIILDPRTKVNTLKDLVAAFVNLDKNSRERKEEEGGGDGTGKGKNQFMVNVIIEK